MAAAVYKQCFTTVRYGNTCHFPTTSLQHFCKTFLRNRSTNVPTTLHPSLLEVDKNGVRSKALHRGSNEPGSASSNKKWQILGALCLERSPVITAKRNFNEEQFHSILLKQEFEKSLFSDHEMQKFEDARKAKRQKSADLVEEDSEVILQTAQDKEDLWHDMYEKFKPASRVTESDTKNDTKSYDRKLDRKLYLLVNQKLGDNSKWVFPQGAWQGSESLRETAENILRKTCGTDLEWRSLGSAPVGWYQYKYPVSADISKEFYGAKVFFFKALLRKGFVTPSSDIEDYQWTTREELQKLVTEKYYDRVERFLFEFNDHGVEDDAEHSDLMRMSY